MLESLFIADLVLKYLSFIHDPKAPRNLPFLYIMCYLLHLIDEYTCQHQVLKQRQKIDCNKEDCSLSNSHSRTKHACTETCVQRLGANQNFIMNRPPNECNRCRLGI